MVAWWVQEGCLTPEDMWLSNWVADSMVDPLAGLLIVQLWLKLLLWLSLACQ